MMVQILHTSDLYHAQAQPDDKGWLTNNLVFQIEWFSSIKELIDNYHPDLLYSDSQMPFGDVGRSLVAHYYNQGISNNAEQLMLFIPANSLRKGNGYRMLNGEYWIL